MNFQTPVALILYNRPEKTERVLAVLRKLRPSTLFIIADGPKNEEDKILCEKTRALLQTIDWDTNLQVNLCDHNSGNAQRTISGLNWVFEQTEHAIILEDDCIPDFSFFEFCQTLLHHYKEDEQVMHISGCNLLGSIPTNASYLFSHFVVPPWGWATWRRAWKQFNPDMDSWQKHKKEIYVNISQEHFKTWTDTFEYLRLHKVTWDIPWNIDIWANRGIGIIPATNLIQNIGFDETATFTKKSHPVYSSLPVTEMAFPLVHPHNKHILFDKELEQACINVLKSLSD